MSPSWCEVSTLGGSVFRKFGLEFMLPTKPAEAKFRFAGSEMVVRFHLRAERPPLRITRLDIPMIPLLGLPYLKNKQKKIVRNLQNCGCFQNFGFFRYGIPSWGIIGMSNQVIFYGDLSELSWNWTMISKRANLLKPNSGLQAQRWWFNSIAERPPLRITWLDIPMICLGDHAWKNREKIPLKIFKILFD